MGQRFVAHLLAPDGDGYRAAAWSPLAVEVLSVDASDAIRADYETDVDLLEAALPLSPLTDAVEVGWLVAFGPTPPAGTAAIDGLKGELRLVVRRRPDLGAATLTLTTRRLR